jgi:trimeric autotransporter adhesin
VRTERVSLARAGWRVLPAAGAIGLVSAVALAGGAGPAAAAGPAGTAPGTISTIAGGTGGPGPATQISLGASMAAPFGVASSGGSLYVADSDSVRQVTGSTDRMSTVAGTGVRYGLLGDGGPATRANIVTGSVAVDHSGNVIIGDGIHYRIRVVAASTGTFYGQPMTAKHIYTIAGDGKAGYSGNGIPATSAKISGTAVGAADGAGNVLFADSNRIRVTAASTGTFYGQAMTAGDIYTIAGNGKAGYSGDGGPATKAELNLPGAVALDGAGNVVIADSLNDRIRVVAVSTGTFYGQAMTAGDIYTIAGNGTPGYSGDGGPATSAELDGPDAVAVDATGNVAIADFVNDRVRVVAAKTGTFYGQAMTAGDIYTVAGNGLVGFAGDGGPATSARLYDPVGLTVDAAGNLVISDELNYRVRVVAAQTGTFYRQAMTAGDIYTVAGDGLHGVPYGDGGPASHAQLAGPAAVAAVPAGALIADTDGGEVQVAAARTGTFYGQAMTAGHIYAIAGTGVPGFSGDGGPATGAQLYDPFGLTVDAAGNVIIADTHNNRIRVVAAQTGTFYGQAMTAGNIYTVAGNGTGGFSGDGGPATSAELYGPYAIAVDAAGNLVIADTTNYRIRVVAAQTGTFYGQAMTAGNIYTVAGNGTGGFSGDGGPATSAEFDIPGGLAVDAAGNLVIADSYNNRIRVVAAKTGTFYGQAMTAGDVYTVAGNGTQGFSGDGGPATSAELYYPTGVAVTSSGGLLIADENSDRIREVTG